MGSTFIPSRSGAFSAGFSVPKAQERGAAAVEMAILTIFLAFLSMGIVDLGRVIFTGLAVEDAAQTGASFASFTPTATVVDVQARVINSVDSPTIDPAQVTVTCSTDPRPKKEGAHIRVTVTNEIDLITPLISPMFGGSITISKDAYADRYFQCSPLPVT